MGKRIYFANDTSDYHGGSWAVCEVIRSCARSAGWTIVTERSKTVLDRQAILSCDAVLVNGEGTIHSNKPRAAHLLKMLDLAQRNRRRTVLCNVSWFGMGNEFDEVLRRLDYLSARDALSARTLADLHGAQAVLELDLSFWHPAMPVAGARTEILASDFYCREFDCFAVPNGGPLMNVPRLDMRAADWPSTLSAVAGAGVFVTGRFHGMMAALKVKTPFVVFPGNTPKMQGVLQWFGNEHALGTDFRCLLARARDAASERAYYDSLFAWAHSMPPWRFPL